MEKTAKTIAAHDPSPFFALINHPLKFRLYLFQNLPAGLFSGLKITAADRNACTVTIPFKWFTKNPFRSTYFACLSMAAEMSTGVLAMAQVYRRRPAVSMLVTGIEGKFYKKATGKTYFTCSDGELIREAVEAAIAENASKELKAHSVGKNEAGETVCEFWIQWSFKSKPRI